VIRREIGKRSFLSGATFFSQPLGGKLKSSINVLQLGVALYPVLNGLRHPEASDHPMPGREASTEE
jgi:hypothetical protein